MKRNVTVITNSIQSKVHLSVSRILTSDWSIVVIHFASFDKPELLAQTDSERIKRHSSDRKSSELSISAVVLAVGGTPVPSNAKVHN